MNFLFISTPFTYYNRIGNFPMLKKKWIFGQFKSLKINLEKMGKKPESHCLHEQISSLKSLQKNLIKNSNKFSLENSDMKISLSYLFYNTKSSNKEKYHRKSEKYKKK